MRFLITIAWLAIFASCSSGQHKSDVSDSNKAQAEMGYDAELAQQLGADEYGMRQYVLCLLNIGVKKLMASEDFKKVEEAHLQYMEKLVAEGKVVLAGPMTKPNKFSGLLVFNAGSIEEVKALMEKDPKVKEKLIIPEYELWTSSAAIMQLNGTHKRIAQKNW